LGAPRSDPVTQDQTARLYVRQQIEALLLAAD
jgi:hypothetical protein